MTQVCLKLSSHVIKLISFRIQDYLVVLVKLLLEICNRLTDTGCATTGLTDRCGAIRGPVDPCVRATWGHTDTCRTTRGLPNTCRATRGLTGIHMYIKKRVYELSSGLMTLNWHTNMFIMFSLMHINHFDY